MIHVDAGAFNGLSSLELLYFSNNGIERISNNVFLGLTSLTYLEMIKNPIIPVEALINTKSLVHIDLRFNEYETLEPYVFQQMKSLTSIYLSDRFICDCRLQWTQYTEQYNLSIEYAYCSEPTRTIGLPITSSSFYYDCTQTESYHCLNKSTTCLTDLVCYNTEESYFCGCPIGYALHSSGQCKDIDECNDELTYCEHVCENTDGSYHCVCDNGYKLASNGYDCEDINECQDLNGGCEFGCSNSIGSFQCCLSHNYSNQTTNLSHNTTDKEANLVCELMDNNYIDCLKVNYTRRCRNGYNLTITNLLCQSANQTTASTTTCPRIEFEWIIPTLVLLTFSFIINIFLILCISIFSIYYIRRIRREKFVPKKKFIMETPMDTFQNNQGDYLISKSNVIHVI